jgi:hypothetical protein
MPATLADPITDLIDGETPVAMTHPDGGSCDLYATGDPGWLLVPAADVPFLLSHGFVVAEPA